MKQKTMVALALIVAFGLVLLVMGGLPAAQGQKPDKGPQWEYKIITGNDNDFTAGVAKGNFKAEVRFNELGAEGWEFVETLFSRNVPARGEIFTCVLFKRVKK